MGIIINAPRYAKIAGIVVLAVFSLLFLGLPGIVTLEPQVPQQPSLLVSPDPTSFNLGNMGTGETTVRTFSILDTGQGTMNWNVSTDQPWMTVNPGNGIGSGTFNISFNTTGLQRGRHSGIITINSNTGTKYGNISLDVSLPSQTPTSNTPILKLSQNSLQFDTISKGEPKNKAFVISNAGGGTLNWKLSTNDPWIELSTLSGSNNGSVFINIDTSDLSPGNYIGTIKVTSNGGNEQVTIKLNIPSPTPTVTTTATTGVDNHNSVTGNSIGGC